MDLLLFIAISLVDNFNEVDYFEGNLILNILLLFVYPFWINKTNTRLEYENKICKFDEENNYKHIQVRI